MHRRPALPLVPLALVAGVLTGPAARAEDTREDQANSAEHYSLGAELGPELDTNAHRTEVVKGETMARPIVSSPLARAVVAASLSDVVGDGHYVAMSATLAAKVFESAAARDEDVGIVETGLVWRAPLGERASLTLGGAYYEAFQRDIAPPPDANGEIDRRDFRSLAPTLRFGLAPSAHTDVGLGAGYRVFVFKPDQSFDFQAPTASLDLRWARETEDGGADWEAALRATYERRGFDGAPFVEPAGCIQGCPPVAGAGTRLDHFFTGALDLARTGRVLLGAGYALHVNRSNSYGETVLRHFLTARFASALPFDLYFALRAEILFARYADRVVVAQTQAMVGSTFVSIEDENRNNVRVDLSRNLTERLQVIARYTYYANELGANSGSYRRQTALLFLSFTVEK